MQKPPAEQYLSIGEASEYLGVSIDTLRRWTKKAKLVAFVSPGKHRYFKTSDLDEVFGTRYERKDGLPARKNPVPKAPIIDTGEVTSGDVDSKSEVVQIEEPKTEESKPIPEILPQAPELKQPDDSPIYSMQADDILHPEEVLPIQEERKPLEVPRYIRNNTISKYDLLLHLRGTEAINPENEINPPQVSGTIGEKSEEVSRPISIDAPILHSILDPASAVSIPEVVKVQPPKFSVQEIVTETKPIEIPKARMVVEEVMEKEVKRENPQKIDGILKNFFLGFLILDAVLFFFWFFSFRVNSPLP